MKRKLSSVLSSPLANRFWLGLLLSEASSAHTSTYWGAFGFVWAHTDPTASSKGATKKVGFKKQLASFCHVEAPSVP